MNWLPVFRRGSRDFPDFNGKIVMVHCNSGHGGGALEQVRIVPIGFNHFIIGRRVELDSWREESESTVTACINIIEVSQIYVFDDLEELRRVYNSDDR